LKGVLERGFKGGFKPFSRGLQGGLHLCEAFKGLKAASRRLGGGFRRASGGLQGGFRKVLKGV